MSLGRRMGPREALGGRRTHESRQHKWACWQREHSESSVPLDSFPGGGGSVCPSLLVTVISFFWLFIPSGESSLSPPTNHSTETV